MLPCSFLYPDGTNRINKKTVFEKTAETAAEKRLMNIAAKGKAFYFSGDCGIIEATRNNRKGVLTMYLDYTILLMIPGLLLGLWAQARVKSAYSKYSKIGTRSGVRAAEAVRHILQKNGAGDVAIATVAGQMTDHYDPRTNTLRLSEGVYNSASIAALGIAAHEAGHALQKAENYRFLALRSVMVPVVNFGSYLSWPIFVAGIIFSFEPLMYAGIIAFSLVVLFSLITLPVEFDASRRAVALLNGNGFLTQEEEQGVRKVLNAAALTYVASFVSALLQLLRLLLILNRNRD